MKKTAMVCAGAALFGLTPAGAASAADLAHGKELFLACEPCHADQPGANPI